MMTAANGETIIVDKPSSGSGIILQEFHTLANAQRLDVEQDANYNVTSITDSSGNVVERYKYDPYGSVTVLNPNGTTRATGSINSSFYGWSYTFQGGSLDTATSQLDFQHRDENTALDRWDEEDPTGYSYVNGPDLYQFVESNPVVNVDPEGTNFFGHIFLSAAHAEEGTVGCFIYPFAIAGSLIPTAIVKGIVQPIQGPQPNPTGQVNGAFGGFIGGSFEESLQELKEAF